MESLSPDSSSRLTNYQAYSEVDELKGVQDESQDTARANVRKKHQAASPTRARTYQEMDSQVSEGLINTPQESCSNIGAGSRGHGKHSPRRYKQSVIERNSDSTGEVTQKRNIVDSNPMSESKICVKICFNCRGKGHTAANCKVLSNDQIQVTQLVSKSHENEGMLAKYCKFCDCTTHVLTECRKLKTLFGVSESAIITITKKKSDLSQTGEIWRHSKQHRGGNEHKGAEKLKRRQYYRANMNTASSENGNSVQNETPQGGKEGMPFDKGRFFKGTKVASGKPENQENQITLNTDKSVKEEKPLVAEYTYVYAMNGSNEVNNDKIGETYRARTENNKQILREAEEITFESENKSKTESESRNSIPSILKKPEELEIVYKTVSREIKHFELPELTAMRIKTIIESQLLRNQHTKVSEFFRTNSKNWDTRPGKGQLNQTFYFDDKEEQNGNIKCSLPRCLSTADSNLSSGYTLRVGKSNWEEKRFVEGSRKRIQSLNVLQIELNHEILLTSKVVLQLYLEVNIPSARKEIADVTNIPTEQSVSRARHNRTDLDNSWASAEYALMQLVRPNVRNKLEFLTDYEGKQPRHTDLRQVMTDIQITRRNVEIETLTRYFDIGQLTNTLSVAEADGMEFADVAGMVVQQAKHCVTHNKPDLSILRLTIVDPLMQTSQSNWEVKVLPHVRQVKNNLRTIRSVVEDMIPSGNLDIGQLTDTFIQDFCTELLPIIIKQPVRVWLIVNNKKMRLTQQKQLEREPCQKDKNVDTNGLIETQFLITRSSSKEFVEAAEVVYAQAFLGQNKADLPHMFRPTAENGLLEEMQRYKTIVSIMYVKSTTGIETNKGKLEQGNLHDAYEIRKPRKYKRRLNLLRKVTRRYIYINLCYMVRNSRAKRVLRESLMPGPAKVVKSGIIPVVGEAFRTLHLCVAEPLGYVARLRGRRLSEQGTKIENVFNFRSIDWQVPQGIQVSPVFFSLSPNKLAIANRDIASSERETIILRRNQRGKREIRRRVQIKPLIKLTRNSVEKASNACLAYGWFLHFFCDTRRWNRGVVERPTAQRLLGRALLTVALWWHTRAEMDFSVERRVEQHLAMWPRTPQRKQYLFSMFFKLYYTSLTEGRGTSVTNLEQHSILKSSKLLRQHQGDRTLALQRNSSSHFKFKKGNASAIISAEFFTLQRVSKRQGAMTGGIALLENAGLLRNHVEIAWKQEIYVGKTREDIQRQALSKREVKKDCTNWKKKSDNLQNTCCLHSKTQRVMGNNILEDVLNPVMQLINVCLRISSAVVSQSSRWRTKRRMKKSRIIQQWTFDRKTSNSEGLGNFHRRKQRQSKTQMTMDKRQDGKLKFLFARGEFTRREICDSKGNLGEDGSVLLFFQDIGVWSFKSRTRNRYNFYHLLKIYSVKKLYMNSLINFLTGCCTNKTTAKITPPAGLSDDKFGKSGVVVAADGALDVDVALKSLTTLPRKMAGYSASEGRERPGGTSDPGVAQRHFPMAPVSNLCVKVVRVGDTSLVGGKRFENTEYGKKVNQRRSRNEYFHYGNKSSGEKDITLTGNASSTMHCWLRQVDLKHQRQFPMLIRGPAEMGEKWPDAFALHCDELQEAATRITLSRLSWGHSRKTCDVLKHTLHLTTESHIFVDIIGRAKTVFTESWKLNDLWSRNCTSVCTKVLDQHYKKSVWGEHQCTDRTIFAISGKMREMDFERVVAMLGSMSQLRGKEMVKFKNLRCFRFVQNIKVAEKYKHLRCQPRFNGSASGSQRIADSAHSASLSTRAGTPAVARSKYTNAEK